MRKVVTCGVAVVLLGFPGVLCAYGDDGGPSTPAAWNRPYRGPDPSVLQFPVVVPLEQARDRLIVGLPSPLSAGSREVEFDAKGQEPHDWIRIELRPRVVIPRGPFGIPIGPPHIEMIQVRTPMHELIDRLFKIKLNVSHRVTVVPGSVSLTSEAGQVRARADLDYHVDAALKAGPLPVPLTPPGSAEGRIRLEVTRALAWSGGKAVLTGGSTSAHLTPRMNFSLLNPLTPPLDPGALLGTNLLLDLFSGKINERVQAELPGHVVDLGAMLKGLENPFDLGIGPKVYVNAERVSPWPWVTDATGLGSGLTIHCRPGTQAKPGTVAFDAAGANPADLTSRVDLEYTFTQDELSRRFADVLRQSLDKDRRIELGDPVVSPAGDAAPDDGPTALGRVLIEVPVRAPVRTTLAALGLLWLDGNIIGMKDVHVEATLSRRDGAGGATRPVGPSELPKADSVEISAALGNLRWDLTDTLKELTSQPRRMRVNSGSVTLKITRAGLKDVYVTPDSGLKLVLHVEGEARLAVAP